MGTPSARSGSVLIVVLWTLVALGVALFALQTQSLDSLEEAHGAFQRECALWAARGGVHYAVAYMEARHPGTPEAILDAKSPPPFYRENRDADPGWIVAEFPYPSRDTHYGVQSEQARMPLTNLTTGALNALFADGTVRARVRAQIVTGRPLPSLQPGGSPAAPSIRHPFELLCVEGVTLEQLFGQDWNDNGVLDPHERESGRRGRCASTLRAAAGLEVDRGIADLVTACTDGRFDPLSAAKPVRDAFLSDWPSMAAAVEKATREQSLERLEHAPAGWAGFAKRHLTAKPTFFRIPVVGISRGQPAARLRCVVEYRPAEAGGSAIFRIAGWRQDG